MKASLCVVLLLAAGSAAAIDKGAPALVLGTDQLLPQGAFAASDLLADPSFYNGSGSRTVDFNNGGAGVDIAIRVFPASGGGYWLAGLHTVPGSGAYEFAIARLHADGSLDSSYNTTGTKSIPTTMNGISDVAKGPGDALYFIGTNIAPGFTDTDVQVECIDADGNRCAGFGVGGIKTAAFDLGDPTHHNDEPYRIAYFGSSLYIVGEADTGSGANANYAVFAFKIASASGTRDPVFGNSPGRQGLFVHNIDHVANGRDVAFDVLVYAPQAFQPRLVMVGQTQRLGTDIDGFVFSVDGVSGAGNGDGFIDETVLADLGNNHQDSLLRVIQRRNGGFVVAGTAQDDSVSPTQQQLLMAAFRPDGSRDHGFGDLGDGTLHKLVLSGYNIPYGLAERAGNRDLVVGVNMTDDLFGDGHPIQGVMQFGASGNMLHALATLDYSGTPRNTQGIDLGMEGDTVLTAGYRIWAGAPTDSDMTIARYIANDSIFADRFGGHDSD
jgi:hypothetical protein